MQEHTFICALSGGDSCDFLIDVAAGIDTHFERDLSENFTVIVFNFDLSPSKRVGREKHESADRFGLNKVDVSFVPKFSGVSVVRGGFYDLQTTHFVSCQRQRGHSLSCVRIDQGNGIQGLIPICQQDHHLRLCSCHGGIGLAGAGGAVHDHTVSAGCKAFGSPEDLIGIDPLHAGEDVRNRGQGFVATFTVDIHAEIGIGAAAIPQEEEQIYIGGKLYCQITCGGHGFDQAGFTDVVPGALALLPGLDNRKGLGAAADLQNLSFRRCRRQRQREKQRKNQQ